MLPLLLRVDNLETGESKQYAFTRSPVRLGRNPLNDIVLDAPFISQWHGLVRFDESVTEYIDLGSTNGTLANGYKLDKNVPVAVGGNVELRVCSLRFFCWRAPAPAELTAASVQHTFGPASQAILDAERRTRVVDAQESVNRFPEALAAIQQLQPLYEAYRQAAANLLSGMRQILGRMPPMLQDVTLLMLQRQMPAILGEEEFQKLARERRLSLTGTTGLAASAAQVVQEFARALTPHQTIASTSDVEKLLVRAATVLETSARAFVELRKGHEQFGSQMAVRTASEMTPLTRAQDAREVLAYLLDISGDVTARIQELTSAYADIMLHQVALLNGMMEGVRSLLHRLGPDEIERDLRERGGGGILFKAAAKWRRFVERHREFTEEERRLSEAVFGREFAKAYSAVVGEEFEEQSARLQSR